MSGEASIWLAVGAGGAAGALLRALVFRAIENSGVHEANRHWAAFGSAGSTLIVNVVGSFTLGCLLSGVDFPPTTSSEAVSIFWVTGLCGGATTFSTLCADAIALARRGDRWRASFVILANTLLGIAALVLGLAVDI